MLAPHFDLIVFPDVTLLPYAGFTDKLRFSADEGDLSRQRYCTWRTYVLGDQQICASSGLGLQAEPMNEQHDFSKTDFVVLFGGRTAASAIQQAAHFRPLIHAIYRSKAQIVAIDNGVFCLAECGLLEDKNVTLHWRHQQQLRELYPRVRIQEKGLFTTAGRITTSVGGTAAIELAQDLLSRKLPAGQAAKGLADMMISQVRNPLDYIAWHDTPSVSDPYVHRALVLMFETMGQAISAEALSTQVGLSRRQLDRKFQSGFDCSVAGYLQQIRLERSAWLLTHTTQTIEHIANQVGYQNLGNFRQQFVRAFKETPTQYRRQQRP